MDIRTCALPADAFLQRYDQGGGYADCFVVETTGQIALGPYVEAFYTTWLFKLERALLSLAGQPSTDVQASQLAAGTASDFAAWNVEARADDQLLMCDVTARTRSWFKVAPVQGEAPGKTQLYFGSAITAIRHRATGRATIGPVFLALAGFHKLYSRALLATARRRLERMVQP